MNCGQNKILHVVESFDRGAVENWLVRMLRHARQRGVDVDWTFYCVLGRPGLMDDEVRSLGARIIYSPVAINQKLAFIRALRVEMKRGKYDTLHCHHDVINAVYLTASAGMPIRRRIAHAHNADENLLTPSRAKQRLLRPLMRWICLASADRIVGISNHVLDAFLAGRPRRPDRDVVHYYGVDPKPFINAAFDRVKFRRANGLLDNALILLFAGRMVPEKNPLFAIDVLADLRRLEPRAVAVFAGTGSLEQSTLARARELGVEDKVRMLGWRDDLPEIMACGDWFILPHPEHPMEGFGLAVVEAQLAGMRMLLSEGIADDALLPTASFVRLPLASGSKAWAKAAIDLLQNHKPSPADALEALRESPMDMDRALNGLMGLYT